MGKHLIIKSYQLFPCRARASSKITLREANSSHLKPSQNESSVSNHKFFRCEPLVLGRSGISVSHPRLWSKKVWSWLKIPRSVAERHREVLFGIGHSEWGHKFNRHYRYIEGIWFCQVYCCQQNSSIAFRLGFRDELEVRFSDMKAKELCGLCIYIFYHVCMIWSCTNHCMLLLPFVWRHHGHSLL